MAPLIAEYDRHMDEMTEQLQRYQVKNTETMRHTNLMRTVKLNIVQTHKQMSGPHLRKYYKYIQKCIRMC